MKDYNAKQIVQIKALINMAIKVHTPGDMMRIMVCITMDAHNRDCIKNKIVLFDIQDVQSFQWQSQLKHKWRVPPPHASFLDHDTHLRPPTGERAEVAICDAIIPYDYEYLGNGFRLVITPLTDRIYVTATQVKTTGHKPMLQPCRMFSPHHASHASPHKRGRPPSLPFGLT
jgi:dynein heavy chain